MAQASEAKLEYVGNAWIGKLRDVVKRVAGKGPVKYIINWSRMYSLWPVHITTACCLPPDEQVSTGSDWKAIEDVEVGDKLIDAYGHETSVIAKFSRHFDGNLVKIIPQVSRYNSFMVTPEHPILIISKEEACRWGHRDKEQILTIEPRFVPAACVKEGDLLIYSYDKRVRDLPEYTIDFMRLLGFYLAEGWTNARRGSLYEVCFGFGQDERENVEEVRRLFWNVFKRKPYENRRNGETTLAFRCKEAASLFNRLAGKYADKKRLAEEVILLPAQKSGAMVCDFAIPVKEVERIPYTGRVYNIETEGSHTFTIKGFAVHNCSVEFGATFGPRFDPERFGIQAIGGAMRQSDLLVIEGTVTKRMLKVLKTVYDQMAKPRYVIAMGDCACSGGLFHDSYSIINDVHKVIPVDVYVPGCPPRPEALLQAMVMLREKIRRSDPFEE